MKQRILFAVVVSLVLGISTNVTASILTFEGFDSYNYVPIDQAYGDNITALSDSVGEYLEGNGFTPHIKVSYNTVGGDPFLEAWHDNYGDLINVAYPERNNKVAEITFTAESGYWVKLNSFDMGAWNKRDRTATVLEVVDSAGSVLWTALDMHIEGDNGHSSFFPDAAASQLTIRFGTDWNIGIDNINFDEMPAPVPAPSSLLLLLPGLAVLARKKF